MRPQYILLIIEYLKTKPDYADNLEQAKANALLAGATEEEFFEALRQLSHKETGVKQPSQKNPFSKSLRHPSWKAIDIALHGAVLLLLVISIVSIVYWQKQQTPQDTHVAAHTNQPVSSSSAFPQVYANEIPIDAQKTFSYPPSDITLSISGTPRKEIVGYFPYWMVDVYDQVNMAGVTTLNLFGLELDNKGNIITRRDKEDPGWSMWNNPKLNDLIKLAKKNRKKIFITLKSFDHGNIEQITNSDDTQKRAISNAIQLVQAKNLDGINIDFEYTGTPAQKITDGFTRFITNLNAELKRQIPTAKLTLATHVTAGTIPSLTDIQALVDHTDGMIVMGYDFHTPQGGAGPVAPLEGLGLNLTSLLQGYLDKVPKDKLLLGVPYYGYDWISAGNATTLPFAELAFTNKSHRINWDNTAQTPWYKYTDEQNQPHTVYFENARSLGIKYDYVNTKDLQGIAIWALGYDGKNKELEQVLVEKFR